MNTTRRSFLATGALAATGMAAGKHLSTAAAENAAPDKAVQWLPTPATTRRNAQRSELVARMKIPAQSGQYEKFKTTSHFDGTAQNPDWLGKAA